MKTKPRARHVVVEKIDDTHFVVSVKEPPVDGKANEGVIEALAEHLCISKSSFRIVSGKSSRNKIVEIN